MYLDVDELFLKDKVSGKFYPKLNLIDLCPSPDTWSKVNGEDRKYRKYNLSSFLDRNGYELVNLFFSYDRYAVVRTKAFPKLSGVCVDSKGSHWFFRIPAAKGFSAYGSKEAWLNDMYFCDVKDGHEKVYCPDNAGIRFHSVEGRIVEVQWYELLLNISSESKYPLYQSCVPAGETSNVFSVRTDYFRSGSSEEYEYEGYDGWEYEDAFEHACYGEVYAVDEYGEGGWELK